MILGLFLDFKGFPRRRFSGGRGFGKRLSLNAGSELSNSGPKAIIISGSGAMILRPVAVIRGPVAIMISGFFL